MIVIPTLTVDVENFLKEVAKRKRWKVMLKDKNTRHSAKNTKIRSRRKQRVWRSYTSKHERNCRTRVYSRLLSTATRIVWNSSDAIQIEIIDRRTARASMRHLCRNSTRNYDAPLQRHHFRNGKRASSIKSNFRGVAHSGKSRFGTISSINKTVSTHIFMSL